MTENHEWISPEKDDGGCEYKYTLSNLTESELLERTSQMSYRLEEGNDECIYQLGVTDDGCLLGIPKDQMDQSIQNLVTIASQIGASVQIIIRQESPVLLSSPG